MKEKSAMPDYLELALVVRALQLQTRQQAESLLTRNERECEELHFIRG